MSQKCSLIQGLRLGPYPQGPNWNGPVNNHSIRLANGCICHYNSAVLDGPAGLRVPCKDSESAGLTIQKTAIRYAYQELRNNSWDNEVAVCG